MYIPKDLPMPRTIIYVASIIFALIIIASNYLVGFNIGDTHITYGAISYPFSFLVMDILSEKYNRKDVIKCLRYGLLLAFIPSYFISTTPLIALASISAFFISQFLDVKIFFRLKQIYPSAWWFRNTFAASFAQVIDTFLFFHIAFFFMLPYYDVFMMSVSDLAIKITVNLIDIPLFYLIAIRNSHIGFFKFLKARFNGAT